MKKHILTAQEIQSLKAEKQELESTQKALTTEQFGKGTKAEMIDQGKLRADIQKLDAAIINATPGKMSGPQKDRLAAEAKELAERIQEGMPTRDEMRRPTNYPGVIQKNQEWEKRNKGNIEKWKQIQRTLEFGGSASNVETLRRHN